MIYKVWGKFTDKLCAFLVDTNQTDLEKVIQIAKQEGMAEINSIHQETEIKKIIKGE